MNQNNKITHDKNTKARPNRSSSQWTSGRSLLLLLLTLDVLIVVAWLIFYHSYYATIAKILGSVWGAITTVLAFIGVKKAKEISLPELLGLQPAKIIIGAYTVIICILSFIFILYEFPIHTVSINAYLDNESQSHVSIFWDSERCGETQEDGSFLIKSVKSGKHNRVARLSGYRDDSATIHVPMWGFKHDYKIRFDSTKAIPPDLPNTGAIHIRSQFDGEIINGADIHIDGAKHNRTTPTTIENIKVGRHFLRVRKIIDEYFYEAEEEITVKAGETIEKNVHLKLIGRLYKLSIRSEPPGVQIYIDGTPYGTTDTTVKLPPGTYTIRLEKSGYRTITREVVLEESVDTFTISLPKE